MGRREASQAAKPLLFLVLVGASAGVAQAKSKPLVSTDALYGTYEVLYDVYTIAWKKADVDGLIKKIPTDDVKKAISKQMAQLPPEAHKAMADAQTAAVQLQATAMQYSYMAYDAVEKVVAGVVHQFELLMPNHAGKIGKTLPDFALFVVHTAILFYICLKVLLFAWSIFTCIICCVCCCRCCRSSGAAPAKAKAKASAEQKGKAAAKTAPKAKAGGKK